MKKYIKLWKKNSFSNPEFKTSTLIAHNHECTWENSNGLILQKGHIVSWDNLAINISLLPPISTQLCNVVSFSLHKSVLIFWQTFHYFRKKEEYQILNWCKHSYNWILGYSSPHFLAIGFWLQLLETEYEGRRGSSIYCRSSFFQSHH